MVFPSVFISGLSLFICCLLFLIVLMFANGIFVFRFFFKKCSRCLYCCCRVLYSVLRVVYGFWFVLKRFLTFSNLFWYFVYILLFLCLSMVFCNMFVLFLKVVLYMWFLMLLLRFSCVFSFAFVSYECLMFLCVLA